MPHRSPASSLELLLAAALLSACGDASGGETSDTTATTGTTSTTGKPTTGEPDSTGEPDTTSAPDTTSGTTTTDASTSGTATDADSSTGADLCAENMLTWENFGEAFMLSWCTGCHNAQLPTDQRAGAPCGVNLDSHAGALPFAANIKLRAVDWQMYEGTKPMPPAAIIPEDELPSCANGSTAAPRARTQSLPAPKCPDP
jgi:hypothetical protein